MKKTLIHYKRSDCEKKCKESLFDIVFDKRLKRVDRFVLLLQWLSARERRLRSESDLSFGSDQTYDTNTATDITLRAKRKINWFCKFSSHLSSDSCIMCRTSALMDSELRQNSFQISIYCYINWIIDLFRLIFNQCFETEIMSKWNTISLISFPSIPLSTSRKTNILLGNQLKNCVCICRLRNMYCTADTI